MQELGVRVLYPLAPTVAKGMRDDYARQLAS